MNGRIRVIVDHGRASNFDDRRILVLASSLMRSRLFQLPILRILPMLVLGFRLWWAGLRTREPAAYVTVGSAHAFVLAFLQSLLPSSRRKTHVLFDFLLERRSEGLAGLLSSWKMRLFERSVDFAVVWGQSDVRIYADEFGIDASKFVFHRFHITLEDYEFEIRDDGYIFAGGNHGRDYATLIEALGGLSIPVFVATQRPEIEALARDHENVEVRGVSHDEFRDKMAGARLVVEAHPVEFFRTAGHQTFLNAMWMGKPFVMADEKSASGYFDKGEHWIVTRAGDPAALRAAVQQLLDDPDLLERIATAGQREARRPEFGTLACMQSIYNHAIRAEAEKRDVDCSPHLYALY